MAVFFWRADRKDEYKKTPLRLRPELYNSIFAYGWEMQ